MVGVKEISYVSAVNVCCLKEVLLLFGVGTLVGKEDGGVSVFVFTPYLAGLRRGGGHS